MKSMKNISHDNHIEVDMYIHTYTYTSTNKYKNGIKMMTSELINDNCV